MESALKSLEGFLRPASLASRQQVYPWSIGAKVRQYPFVYMYKNHKFTRNFMRAWVFMLPVSVYLTVKAHYAKKAMYHKHDKWDFEKMKPSELKHRLMEE
ncbi:hypothetical protein Ciccas_003911 [Cichlidogyrus casuarinus]|uniref:Uncharacterized protein n=1 Tax=Cichlidogyrus casuarinus TaxID=1844966 RepID=A0ABD2QD03_9PLAT